MRDVWGTRRIRDLGDRCGLRWTVTRAEAVRLHAAITTFCYRNRIKYMRQEMASDKEPGKREIVVVRMRHLEPEDPHAPPPPPGVPAGEPLRVEDLKAEAEAREQRHPDAFTAAIRHEVRDQRMGLDDRWSRDRFGDVWRIYSQDRERPLGIIVHGQWLQRSSLYEHVRRTLGMRGIAESTFSLRTAPPAYRSERTPNALLLLFR